MLIVIVKSLAGDAPPNDVPRIVKVPEGVYPDPDFTTVTVYEVDPSVLVTLNYAPLVSPIAVSP